MLRVIDTKWKRGLHNLKALKLVLVVFNKKYKLTIKNTSDIKKFIDKLSLFEKASSELKTKL